MTREQWLEARRTSIGGSDSSAIVGYNPFSSPYTVWADKTGRLPEREDNEAMKQGRDLEEYVAQRWCEDTGKKVRKVNAILFNEDYPFAHANIDRMVVGENAGLECKTTSVLNLQRFKDGDYPNSYYIQCMHYLAVTGLDRWYLAVLVLNKALYTYTIERDEEAIAALMQMESDFWRYVENDTPPPMDGEIPTTDALKTIYSGVQEGTIELYGRQPLIEEYYAEQTAIKVHEKKIEQIKQILRDDLGTLTDGYTDDYKVTNRECSKQVFQFADFQADYPDIDLSGYYKTSVYKTFKITKKGK